MLINDDDLEIIVAQVLDEERKRIYDDWIYDGNIVYPVCHIKKRTMYRKKTVVLMEQEAWENYQSEVKEILQALSYAHKQIEYFKQVQYQETKISFDDYIKKEVLDYDADDFEKVRNRFEEVYKGIDDELELT